MMEKRPFMHVTSYIPRLYRGVRRVGIAASLALFFSCFVMMQPRPAYATIPQAPQQVTGQNNTTVGSTACSNAGYYVYFWGVCVFNYQPCDAVGVTKLITNSLINALLNDLYSAANALETWLWNYLNNVLAYVYAQQNWLEHEMMSGWGTYWYYELLPGLQSMTRQLNVNLAQQAYQLQANADASTMEAYKRAHAKSQKQDMGVIGNGQMCVAATVSTGFTRATDIARDMRMVWERDSLAAGLNETSDGHGNPYPGASSAIGSYVQQYNNYLNLFCDPNGNAGKNYCLNSTTLNPPLYNADVEPVKYIYNDLTIPIDSADNPTEGQDVATAVYDIINNMVGIPAMEAMSKKTLATVPGQHIFMMRRSYLARYAAIRSVPDLIASWRMPGSGQKLGQEVKDMRVAAGAAPNSYTGPSVLLGGYISKDPSYKEVMHAVSIDQFNSGKFALQMSANKNRLQMEKLNLSVFYLMQLRDYYKLLERTALVLAVQDSIRDQKQMHALQDVYKSAPVK